MYLTFSTFNVTLVLRNQYLIVMSLFKITSLLLTTSALLFSCQKIELEEQIPKFYAGGATDKGFFLIIEDISDKFSMVENAKGLSLCQIELALENIAHFHALSYAYGQFEKVDYSQLYPIVQGLKLMDENDHDSCIKK